MAASGGIVPSEMDRHATVVVVENGDELEPCAEGIWRVASSEAGEAQLTAPHRDCVHRTPGSARTADSQH